MAGSSISLPAVKTQEDKRLGNAAYFFAHTVCTEINLLCCTEENGDVLFLLGGKWLS